MNLSEFHFIRPYWLLAFLPYLIVIGMTFRNKLSQGSWNQVCDAELLPFILQERGVTQNRWPLTTAAVAGFLVILALAGPTWERLPAPVFRNASALVIALDLSRSMDAADIKPSRLVRARYKIADILKRRKDGQTALIVYAGDVFTVTPLTDDTDTISSQLSALTTEIMPVQGSDTAAALDKAVKLLQQAGLQQGHILLITDGVDVDETLDTVKSLGSYQLSILAVGSADGAPINIAQGGFLKDSGGNIVIPRLNRSELKKLSDAGNGRLQMMTADDSDISNLISSLETQSERQGSEQQDLLLDLWQERGPWLLLLVLPLAALTFRRGLLGVAWLLLLPLPENSHALEWQDLWQSRDQQAQQAYRQESYEQAADQFTDPAWKAASHYRAGQFDKSVEALQGLETSDGYFNQGNALANGGKLQEALAAYQQSLKIDPNNEDAKYNKELVEKELEKQQQQQQQQNSEGQQQSENPSQDQQNQDSDGEQSGQKQDQQDAGNQSQPEQADQKPEGQDGEQSEPNQQQEKSAEQQQAEQEPSSDDAQEQGKDTRQAVAEPDQSNVESKQANEQWLKRIPDDPAGLLRRKFKYQYGQRKNKPAKAQPW